jgi:hypothetical protein
MTSPLIQAVEQHLAAYLGKPEYRYQIPVSNDATVQVFEFAEKPCDDTTTLCSAGLCDLCPTHLLVEIVLALYKRFFTQDIVKLVGTVIKQATEGKLTLESGVVLGPAGPLASSTEMEAFFVYPPTYFPEPFAQIRCSGLTVSFQWLIPIYRQEANWITQHGSEAFASLLDEHDPDLLDLRRNLLPLA